MADEGFERASRAVEALGDVSTHEKLDLLLMAWLVQADTARHEQLSFPDGFSTEQARQLLQLAVAMEMVCDAVPDFEGSLREAQDPDDDSGPKGGDQ